MQSGRWEQEHRNEAARQIESAVGFANVLPEVPSLKTSLFAPCVESLFGDCVSMKVSLVDSVKKIKCYCSIAI